MDRKRQLGNVAFGGDWSEAILTREEVAAAVAVLSGAVGACIDQDPRTPEVSAALDLICTRVARGKLLAAAWHRAVAFSEPSARASEMHRVLANIMRVLGAER